MQDTRCPKEPHAQRSWHLQRSLPAQSEDLRTEVWLASLSDERRASGSSNAARSLAPRRAARRRSAVELGGQAMREEFSVGA